MLSKRQEPGDATASSTAEYDETKTFISLPKGAILSHKLILRTQYLVNQSLFSASFLINESIVNILSLITCDQEIET